MTTDAKQRALRFLLRQIDFGEHVRRRAVQDAISAADAATATRRAEMFEWARPRPTDYRGKATDAELAEADRRCRETAQAYRNRAALLIMEEVFGDAA